MIVAPVFVHREEDQQAWGSFRFDALPSPGDRINITDHRGRLQRLKVLYIAHEPLPESDPPVPDRVCSFVHAEWLDEFY